MVLPAQFVNSMLYYYRIVLYAIVAAIMATGCVPKDPFPPEQHYASSAINVPFIPPRSELCGSTSIEMVSSYWQSTTSFVPKLSMQELDGRTLIPAKGGTLQIELVTAARSEGLIAYPLEPTYEALFSELSAHHPVIVLVNRSFSWHPLWHYTPVIGYDEENEASSFIFPISRTKQYPLQPLPHCGNEAVIGELFFYRRESFLHRFHQKHFSVLCMNLRKQGMLRELLGDIKVH